MIIVSAWYSNSSKSLELQDQGIYKLYHHNDEVKEHEMMHNEFKVYPHECYTINNC